jgi:hypothetical protein
MFACDQCMVRAMNAATILLAENRQRGHLRSPRADERVNTAHRIVAADAERTRVEAASG